MAISPVSVYPLSQPSYYNNGQKAPLVYTASLPQMNAGPAYPAAPRKDPLPLVCGLLASCAALFLILPLFVMGRKKTLNRRYVQEIGDLEFRTLRHRASGNRILPYQAPLNADALIRDRNDAIRKMRFLANHQNSIRSGLTRKNVKRKLGVDFGPVKDTKPYKRIIKDQNRARLEMAAEYQNLFSRDELSRLLKVKLPAKLPTRYV